MTSALEMLTGEIARRLPQHIDARVESAAREIATSFGASTAAVLFYGSCLRSGEVENQMLDFYVLVDDYRPAYGRFWPALANRLLPPNVYYFEMALGETTLRAKYAVLALDHFQLLCSPRTFNPAIWARFSQPVAFAYCRDETVRGKILYGLAQAVITLLATTAPLFEKNGDNLSPWRQAFTQTYRTEFRAERKTRAADIAALSEGYYRELTPFVLQAVGQDPHFQPYPRWRSQLAWALRRFQGRLLHIARLMKAAVTFSGGVDYLAWKITRHSGVAVTVKPWHRRHPIVAGLWLFLHLRLKGAFR